MTKAHVLPTSNVDPERLEITITISTSLPQLASQRARHAEIFGAPAAVAPAAAAPDAPNLLTKGELAKTLRTSTGSVDRWVRAGCPCDRVGDRRRFDLSAVRKWLSTHKATTVDAAANDSRLDVSRVAQRAGLRRAGGAS